MQYINPDIEIIPLYKTLWQIKNVFTETALEKLLNGFDIDSEWIMDRPLSRLSSRNDSFRDIGEEFAVCVSQTIDKAVQFAGGKLFLDLPNSHVPKHFDNPQITVMTQVYLTNAKHLIPGTLFVEPYAITVPYEYNCGYINLNIDKKLHWSPVLRQGIRQSIGYQFIEAD